jgi:urease accessory protein
VIALRDPAALARMTLAHWLSPAFPTGAFAFSHGLEQAVASGAVVDADGFRAWLGDLLHHGTGWQDAILIAQGLRPGADLDALSDLACALAPSSERLNETRTQGAAFARTVAALTGRTLPPRPVALAVAEAAAPLGLPAEEVIAAHLAAFATNLTQVAIRLIPLGQSEGHAVLAALLPGLPALATRAAAATLDDLGAASLGADLAAMAHETLQPRLFQS